MKTHASRLIDHSEGGFKKAIQVARERKDLTLIHCIQRLRKRYGSENRTVNISNDFCPLSFNFWFLEQPDNRCSLNGGIIFHGKHDNGGDGSAPTFSVCLTTVDGWALHT